MLKTDPNLHLFLDGLKSQGFDEAFCSRVLLALSFRARATNCHGFAFYALGLQNSDAALPFEWVETFLSQLVPTADPTVGGLVLIRNTHLGDKPTHSGIVISTDPFLFLERPQMYFRAVPPTAPLKISDGRSFDSQYFRFEYYRLP